MDEDAAGGLKPLTKEERRKMDRHLRANSGLVHKHFHMRMKRWLQGQAVLDKDDIIQEEYLGLWRATQDLDPTKAKLSTYSFIWMTQRCKRYLQDNSSVGVRVPVHIQEAWYKLNKLEKELGRKATDADTRTRLEWEPGRAKFVRDAMKGQRHKLELDAPLGPNDDRAGIDLELDPQSRVTPQEIALVKSEEKKRVADLLSRAGLTPQETKILCMRFGLNQADNETFTLEQIGQKLQLTRERIRQIEAKALEKLKIAAGRITLVQPTRPPQSPPKPARPQPKPVALTLPASPPIAPAAKARVSPADQSLVDYLHQHIVVLYEITKGKPFKAHWLTWEQRNRLKVDSKLELVDYLRRVTSRGDYLLMRKVGRQIQYDWVKDPRPRPTLTAPPEPDLAPNNALSICEQPQPLTESEALVTLQHVLLRRNTWVGVDELQHHLSRHLGWEEVSEQQVESLLASEARLNHIKTQVWKWSTRAVIMYRYCPTDG